MKKLQIEENGPNVLSQLQQLIKEEKNLPQVKGDICCMYVCP
jgi:hypothetical protein